MRLLTGLGICFLGASMAGAHAGAISFDLGTAASFAVLAGSTVTNTGTTTIDGNLGVWPGTAVTGFPPGIVTAGTVHAGDTVAALAHADVAAAYAVAASASGGTVLTGTDLGGLTLTPGIYTFASSAQLTGALVLDAQGASQATFLFQIGTALTTAAASSVVLVNAGIGDSVVFQVGSSATLGTGTAFTGDILSLSSITLDTGAAIQSGGAFARDGAVTLSGNTVSIPADVAPVGTSVPEPASAMVLAVGALLALAGRTRGRQQAAA